ncbi:MAG: GNAT family N-acetyltransferase [Microscillaceae bacterium]|nr:GNAT family N-acetyltransferase [Microscillaceae bacterium]MDW8459910.1 GNAT family N-acetyltransferase [Cytophagales bacterium]
MGQTTTEGESNKDFQIIVANASHSHLAEQICQAIEESAKQRGTGIAKRSPDYIRSKIQEGKAIIALTQAQELAGFCYIETWEHGKFIAHSGLVVLPEYRKFGLATRIKKAAFELSIQKYPEAKIFGITTSLAVMKINTELGYKPVTFSELTTDDSFWDGCQSCVNYDVLTRTNRKMCLCTGMLYDPAWEKEKSREKEVVFASKQADPPPLFVALKVKKPKHFLQQPIKKIKKLYQNIWGRRIGYGS